MKTTDRRNFLKAAVTVAGGTALGVGSGILPGGSARAQSTRPTADQYRSFVWKPIPQPRAAQNVEIMWTTPFNAANGMQASDIGMWLIDGQTRGPHGERTSHVYLCSYDGEILRQFRTGGETPSGMTYDGQDIWLAATYSREIIRADAHTGRTISSHFTPGASVIYNTPWDPQRREGPLESPEDHMQAPPPAGTPGARESGGSDASGRGLYREGTGAHGMDFRNGKLWVAVPPSRMIYTIDPDTWLVEHIIPTVHKRPHGIGFDGDSLWESDTDVSTFYRRNPETGEVLGAIRLGDDHPQPHGMTVHEGYIWWVDDVPGNSVVCRMRIPSDMRG